MTDRDMYRREPEREEVGGPLPEAHASTPEHIAAEVEAAKRVVRVVEEEARARLKGERRG